LADFDAEPVRRGVAFLFESLKLEPGQIVFDQCCGLGRMSMPLAERGVRIIGVDGADNYARAAQARADELRLPCTYEQGDAYEYVAPSPCDAAFNWFTSFGYEENDECNIRMLRCAYESLRPGGRFALDFMNVPRVLAEFRPWYIDRPNVPAYPDLIVLHEATPDFSTGMFESIWTFIREDGQRKTRRVATRMYMPHEILALLKRCGFVDAELFGSNEKIPFDRRSPRCIVLARKP
jgi:SAM-dependent methyltransferase